MEFSPAELSLAYRKAKADLYFSSDSRSEDLLLYEESLEENLIRLSELLASSDRSWIAESKFLGDLRFIPAVADLEKPPKNLIRAETPSPERSTTKHKVVQASFRVMSAVSIDFHVLSALWIGHVGSVFDYELSSSVKANRPRRKAGGEYNWYSAGSFKPYYSAYRDWQDGAFDVMQQAIGEGYRVVTLTADATAYFHRLSPGFLVHPEFQEALNVDLDQRQAGLNELFVEALAAWEAGWKGQVGEEALGLPVDLPASSLIGNLALLEFDRAIEEDIKPLYYGRYVDDILLVVRDECKINKPEDLWHWLSKKIPQHLVNAENQISLNEGQQETCSSCAMEESAGSGNSHVVRPYFMGMPPICFSNAKNRIYILSGEAGESVIVAIKENIAERSSEWRTLPTFQDGTGGLGASLISALQDDGQLADSIGRTGTTSTRRADFALKLRDLETCSREVSFSSWSHYWEKFIAVVKSQMFQPDRFFELSKYFTRIIRLTIVLRQFNDLNDLLDKVQDLRESIVDAKIISLKGFLKIQSAEIQYEIVEKWFANLYKSFFDVSLECGVYFDLKLPKYSSQFALKFEDISIFSDEEKFRNANVRLFSRDLADNPFKNYVMPLELRPPFSGNLVEKIDDSRIPLEMVPPGLSQPMLTLAEVMLEETRDGLTTEPDGYRPGVVFPTRPFHPSEIFASTNCLGRSLSGTLSKDRAVLSEILLGTRGFVMREDVELGFSGANYNDRWGAHVKVPSAAGSNASLSGVNVAVTMLETKEFTWNSAVHGAPDLSLTRFRALAELINSAIKGSDKIDYLVLPELSVPSVWFLPLANKLKNAGINLISGIEYYRSETKNKTYLENQIWISLVHDAFEFNSLAVYRQSKQYPAPGEAAALDSHVNGSFHPDLARWKTPPVVNHGGFIFSTLVCSEMTDISSRAALRGQIDTLFVVEWNRDINTFASLIESAALDIHTFVVQVNNRTYGDSRIRVPAKEPHLRDAVQVRGGLNDYFVVGELNVSKLREFQSQFRVLDGIYKPLPQGFRISNVRKRVPRTGGAFS